MKKGLKTLITGTLLFFVGVFLLPIAIVLAVILGLPDEHPFIIPGSTEVTADEPGRYYLWNDFQTVYDGTSYNRSKSIPDGLEIAVNDETGNRLLFNSDTSISSSSGGRSKNSIGYVEVVKPGKLTVSVSGNTDPRIFSFSPSGVMKILGLILGGFALSAVMALAGTGIAVWGVVILLKRRKSAQDAGGNALPQTSRF